LSFVSLFLSLSCPPFLSRFAVSRSSSSSSPSIPRGNASQHCSLLSSLPLQASPLPPTFSSAASPATKCNGENKIEPVPIETNPKEEVGEVQMEIISSSLILILVFIHVFWSLWSLFLFCGGEPPFPLSSPSKNSSSLLFPLVCFVVFVLLWKSF
ncbi:hypothetical protein B296_00018911, partial [Ensete ventricosum]